MTIFLKFLPSVFSLFLLASCHYHYGPEENINDEILSKKTSRKAYAKGSEPKSRTIQDIEADLAALKVNMDMVADNLDKSDKENSAQLMMLRAEVQQLKHDYDDELTRMYWIMAGVTGTLLLAGFFGIQTYVEKKVREDKLSDIES